MAAVGLFFAPLAPLVAVAAAIIFWISSWVYKYQLMFVFVSRVETGGVSSRARSLRVRLLTAPSLAALERGDQSSIGVGCAHAGVDNAEYVDFRRRIQRF